MYINQDYLDHHGIVFITTQYMPDRFIHWSDSFEVNNIQHEVISLYTDVPWRYKPQVNKMDFRNAFFDQQSTTNPLNQVLPNEYV